MGDGCSRVGEREVRGGTEAHVVGVGTERRVEGLRLRW